MKIRPLYAFQGEPDCSDRRQWQQEVTEFLSSQKSRVAHNQKREEECDKSHPGGSEGGSSLNGCRTVAWTRSSLPGLAHDRSKPRLNGEEIRKGHPASRKGGRALIVGRKRRIDEVDLRVHQNI